jgi:hypothetical protein
MLVTDEQEYSIVKPASRRRLTSGSQRKLFKSAEELQQYFGTGRRLTNGNAVQNEPMMDITDTSAGAMVTEQLPAYCYYQPTAACIPEGTTTEVGSSSGYTTTSYCTAHNDCSGDLPFCYQGLCSSCTECHQCHDGVDGTCGSCSTEFYPSMVAPADRATACTASFNSTSTASRRLSGSNNSTSTTTYSVDVVPGGWVYEISWQFDDQPEVGYYTRESNGPDFYYYYTMGEYGGPFEVTLGPGTHTLAMMDSFGDGWNGAIMTLTDQNDGSTVAGPFGGDFTWGSYDGLYTFETLSAAEGHAEEHACDTEYNDWYDMASSYTECGFAAATTDSPTGSPSSPPTSWNTETPTPSPTDAPTQQACSSCCGP